ncbi:hypothetical protein BDP27DRAFT_1371899 [Rhodocollybia butyracea]|uniref:Uncharacterized protein n=1 Tax=Rhodocollybia butyracea TaxID=206335 RepID=A0A9P5P9J4_9AGAR|nr:hypothetical protein BDP27DRAFT_1371899 [Rhodocollybia butyracea]
MSTSFTILNAVSNIRFKARFALSTTEKWGQDEDNFCYPDFYQEIIDFFEDDPDDPVSKEILEWWNLCIFKNCNGLGASSTSHSTSENNETAEPSSIDLSRKVRQAQKAEWLAAAAPSTAT